MKPLILATLALLPVLHAQNKPAAPAKRPNVIFFITDDQVKDMMNWLPEGKGKNLTPATDRLAAQGTIMMQQHVTSPVCTPSRYGCLTGQYPSRSSAQAFLNSTNEANGQTVVQWNTFIKPDQPCLPAMFRNAGYFTGIVGKNHVIDSKIKRPQWTADPYAQETKEILAENARTQAADAKSVGFDYAASLYYNNPNENGVKALASHNLNWIAEGALDFLGKTGDKPFFLYLATTVPHGPQEPGRSWDADRRITSEGMRNQPIGILPDRSTLKPRLQQAGIKGWGKENILWLDDLFGAVIKKLEDTGKLDNTIIVYFNDQGQRSKGTIYQGGVHGECFFWRKGGFPAGNLCTVPVSNVDFAPTLLDLAGVKYEPKSFDGRSFAEALMGRKPKEERSLYFELGYTRGVRKGNWKYIALRYPKPIAEMSREERQSRLDEFNKEQERKERPIYTKDPMQPFSHVSPIPGGGDAEHLSMGKYKAFYDADQLYNLADDPDEQNNLAKDPVHKAKLKELKEELKKHLATVPGTFGELKPE